MADTVCWQEKSIVPAWQPFPTVGFFHAQPAEIPKLNDTRLSRIKFASAVERIVYPDQVFLRLPRDQQRFVQRDLPQLAARRFW